MGKDVEKHQKGEGYPILSVSMKLRAGGQSQGEHQRLGGHVCLAAQDNTRRLISCRLTPPRVPQALNRLLRPSGPDMQSLEGQERRGHRPQEVVVPGL